MLNRWVPLQDEGASMLRLLNLLTWSNTDLPSILCGPFYESVEMFDAANSDQSLNINMPIIYEFPHQHISSALIRLTVWRVNVLSHLSNQIGVLSQYFPLDSRRGIASKLFALFDSMFPLINELEKNPQLTLSEVYKKSLQPEKQRHYVIDYSYTYFISYLLPYVVSATSIVSPLVLEILNCTETDPDFKNLVEILRCITIKRERTRHLLNIVFSALRGDGASNWLSNIVVTVIKYALLGNYPDSEQYADFKARRQIYNLSRENILSFFFSCGEDGDAILGIVQALLSSMLMGIFSQKSIDYIPTNHLIIQGDVVQYLRIMCRILKLVTNFYPAPTKENLVSDIYRFINPVRLQYSNIFFAIHAASLNNRRNNENEFEFLYSCRLKLTRLDSIYVAILLNITDEEILDQFIAMQNYFNQTKTLWRPPTQNNAIWEKLCSLSLVVVAGYTFHVSNTSQALYFEQAARLLKIVGSVAVEKTSVLYCNNCNTIRFRPVGIHLPSSHITLLADLANNRVHCVDCDSFDLCTINLLGKLVRCFLSNKKARTMVTLGLCSACLHISVCGFYAHKHGIICKECELTVRNLQQVPKVCLACKCIMSKITPSDPVWNTLDNFNNMSSRYWCKRCIPYDYKMFKKTRVPIFLEDSLKAVSSTAPIFRKFY